VIARELSPPVVDEVPITGAFAHSTTEAPDARTVTVAVVPKVVVALDPLEAHDDELW